jgi:hypothetical protein
MMMARAYLFFLIFVCGCSTEPPQMGAILVNFTYKNTQPSADSLYPVYPNPFNRATGDTSIFLQFAVSDSGAVNLVIQNALGDEIVLFSDSALSPGFYSGYWNPLTSGGSSLISGIYFVTLNDGDFINSRLVYIEENE